MLIKPFGCVAGKDVSLYILKSDTVEVAVMELGASIQSLKVKVNGVFREVTLGFDDISGYLASRTYFGATVGRVANRIAHGRFSLDDKEYRLDVNNGENYLHGGFNGYDTRVFNAKVDGEKVVFSLSSANGDQGFPGELKLFVEYSLCGDTLNIVMSAIADGKTVWAPVNHAFFNLCGSGMVGDTVMKINAARYTPVNNTLIPTGELASVNGTSFDFRAGKALSEGIFADCEQTAIVGGGIDHNYVLDGEHAATAMCGGVALDVYTDMPGMQLYTGNFLGGEICRGAVVPKHGAFCLEPQFFPNAVNTDGFVKPIIYPGEMQTHYVKFRLYEIAK